MSYQANLTTIGGTIKHARRLNTKSGLIMTWAVLDGYKINMESLFFGLLAEAVLNLEQDALVEIKGRLQSSSHKDDSGTWVNKIQLVANQITLPDGQIVEGAKKQADSGKQKQPVTRPRQPQQQSIPGSRVRKPALANDRDPKQFDYFGGPF